VNIFNTKAFNFDLFKYKFINKTDIILKIEKNLKYKKKFHLNY